MYGGSGCVVCHVFTCVVSFFVKFAVVAIQVWCVVVYCGGCFSLCFVEV